MYKVGDLVQVTGDINNGSEALAKRAFFKREEYAVIIEIHYHKQGGRIQSLDGKRISNVNFQSHIKRAHNASKATKVLYGKSNN